MERELLSLRAVGHVVFPWLELLSSLSFRTFYIRDSISVMTPELKMAPPLIPRQYGKDGPCGGQTVPAGEVTLAPGEKVCVSSPNFPNNYPSNAFLQWIVRIWVIYCGDKGPTNVFETCSSLAVLIFKSDGQGEKQGFSCSIADTASAPAGPYDCKCAASQPEEQNRGRAKETDVNEYPWLVGVSLKGKPDTPFCGGSIYNDEWVITAAHCFDKISPHYSEVLFNMWAWRYGPTAIYYRDVDDYVIHPAYDKSTVSFDNKKKEKNKERKGKVLFSG
ncbi:plasma kallikrein-like, partial [Penaeus monodon]|uniref:plasma kallikrein-like n=1 Tax=Penaeus monodon TaxID=6687 RepID=UPI0018A7A145